MRTYRPERVSNADALTLLESSSTTCKSHIESIRHACTQYLRHKGHPAELKPLGLGKAVEEELHDYYRAKRQRDGLAWIHDYREAKSFSHCPLCGNPGPTQLEHYLPRSPYAEFTIFSWNLLPSCGACNLKRNKFANAHGTVLPLIHPYLDKEIYGQPLLSASIKGPFAQATFEPAALTTLPADVLKRAQRHIEKCVASRRFHEYLSAKWNVWRGKADEYKTLSRLKQEMELELRVSCGPLGVNSWDAAFFRGVLGNDDALAWLCKNPQHLHGFTKFSAS